MTYEWKPGSRFGIAAEVVGSRIEALRDRDGLCRPAALVDDARPAEAPLHPLFEWDDGVAGEKWRQEQARGIVRAVRVVADGGEIDQQPPAFVHVHVLDADGERTDGYVPTVEAMGAREYRRQVVREALDQMEGMRRRYELLTELRPLWSALDAVKENIPE